MRSFWNQELYLPTSHHENIIKPTSCDTQENECKVSKYFVVPGVNPGNSVGVVRSVYNLKVIHLSFRILIRNGKSISISIYSFICSVFTHISTWNISAKYTLHSALSLNFIGSKKWKVKIGRVLHLDYVFWLNEIKIQNASEINNSSIIIFTHYLKQRYRSKLTQAKFKAITTPSISSSGQCWSMVTLENQSQTHSKASSSSSIGRWRWRSVWIYPNWKMIWLVWIDKSDLGD